MNQSDLHGKVFLFFLLIVTLAFFSILLPFYGGIFWGFVLAILFMPLNDFFLRKMPAKKNLAALLTLAICLLIVIIPLIVVAGSLVEESSVLYQKILNQKIDSDASFHHFISQLPDWAVDVLNHFGISTFAELQKEATRLILVTRPVSRQPGFHHRPERARFHCRLLCHALSSFLFAKGWT